MTKIVWGAGFVVALMAAAATSPVHPLQDRPPREDYNSGAYLYRTFCASCHGETGRGDGPVADIADRRPSDLTVLSRNNGGAFPRREVTAVLENLAPLPGHAAPAMPKWGDVLRRTEGDDELVIRQRIDALVSHVESLQRH